jgi:hypothetical protein
MQEAQVIVLATPVFFGLIAIELLVGWDFRARPAHAGDGFERLESIPHRGREKPHPEGSRRLPRYGKLARFATSDGHEPWKRSFFKSRRN